MFEVKLLVQAPGLETAINNLAAAIANSTNAEVTLSGLAPLTVSSATSVLAPVMVTDDSEADDEPGATGAEAGAVDAWGLPWNPDIHSKAADKIAKTTGQWKKKKGVEETFFQRTQTEMIRTAAAAGTYTGPANLVPKPEGYVAPVLTQDPATGALIPAPPATTAAVPAPPATTAAVPAPTGTVAYTHDVLQSAVMKMFSNPAIGANAASIAPRLLALYEVKAITDTPADKIESFVKLIEDIEANPAVALETVSGAENKKLMGMPF